MRKAMKTCSLEKMEVNAVAVCKYCGVCCHAEGSRLPSAGQNEDHCMGGRLKDANFPPFTYLLFNNKIILDSVILSKQPVINHEKRSATETL